MPFVRSALITYTEALVAALLAAFSARPSAALLQTATCHLYTASSAPISPQSTVSQFTEASFAGYAPVVMSPLIGPINLPSGEGMGVHVEADFLCTSTATPGYNIIGYWVDNGATVLYAAESFASPIPIVFLGDFVSLDVIFGVDNPVNVS